MNITVEQQMMTKESIFQDILLGTAILAQKRRKINK